MKIEPVSGSAIGHPDVPTDDTTRQLTRIWQELLGIDSIAPNQNYFDLGGDSSLAVHLFVQIERAFNVKLPLATLFDAPTIEELAQVLRSGGLAVWMVAACSHPNFRFATSVFLHAWRGWKRFNLPGDSCTASWR